MDKILLEVFCVATSKSYDFWISKKMEIVKVKEKIIQQITLFEKNEELFSEDNDVFLMGGTDADVFEETWTVEEVGLHSGDKIVII